MLATIIEIIVYTEMLNIANVVALDCWPVCFAESGNGASGTDDVVDEAIVWLSVVVSCIGAAAFELATFVVISGIGANGANGTGFCWYIPWSAIGASGTFGANGTVSLRTSVCGGIGWPAAGIGATVVSPTVTRFFFLKRKF